MRSGVPRIPFGVDLSRLGLRCGGLLFLGWGTWWFLLGGGLLFGATRVLAFVAAGRRRRCRRLFAAARFPRPTRRQRQNGCNLVWSRRALWLGCALWLGREHRCRRQCDGTQTETDRRRQAPPQESGRPIRVRGACHRQTSSRSGLFGPVRRRVPARGSRRSQTLRPSPRTRRSSAHRVRRRRPPAARLRRACV